MKEASEGRRIRHGIGRRATGRLMAVALVGLAVVVVGVVGYLVLNAATPAPGAGHSTSSTVHSCYASGGETCKSQTPATAANVNRGVALGLPAR